MTAKLALVPLAHQPGTTFEYGMSTDVLGHVIEAVSGMELDRFFAEHITGPLGMADTAFTVHPGEEHRLAEPHRPPPRPALPPRRPPTPGGAPAGTPAAAACCPRPPTMPASSRCS